MPVGGSTVHSPRVDEETMLFLNGRELRGENHYNLLMILEVITHILKINACEPRTVRTIQRKAQAHVYTDKFTNVALVADISAV